jgi:hypothetical protein
MLYFIHHPTTPIVILTNNPYIVLSYRLRSWSTTLSWSEVLEDHVEWREDSSVTRPTYNPIRPVQNTASSLFSRILSFMGASIAFVPGYTPSGVQVSVEGLRIYGEGDGSDAYEDEDENDEYDEVRSTSLVHFLTALERSWYFERGLETPVGGWTLCTEGDWAFGYRLETGVWQMDMVPEYEEWV